MVSHTPQKATTEKYNEIMKSLTLPDKWSIEQYSRNTEIAGYTVVSKVHSHRAVQGLLLLDREYQRLAIILYPVAKSLEKYKIAATEAFSSDTPLDTILEPLEREIEKRDDKLDDC